MKVYTNGGGVSVVVKIVFDNWQSNFSQLYNNLNILFKNNCADFLTNKDNLERDMYDPEYNEIIYILYKWSESSVK